MAFMEKWNEVSDNMFGDFTSDKNRYGILKNSPSDYYISRFNDSNRLDGVSAHRLSTGSVEFAKYIDGDVVCPTVTVEKKDGETSGRVVIRLAKIANQFVTLDLNTKESSFEYYSENEKGEKTSSFGIRYSGREGALSFVRYDSEKHIDIPKSFKPDKPIACFDEIGFDEINDYDDFDYYCDDDVAFETSDDMENPGVGCFVWDDQYVIGELKDSFRSGWQIYQWNDYYQIFHADKTMHSGLTVDVNDTNKAIFITSKYSVDEEKTESSWALIYYKKVLYFADYWNKQKDFGPQPNLVGLAIPSFNHINFVEWHRPESWSFDNCTLVDSYDAYLMYDDEKKNKGSEDKTEELEQKMMNLTGVKDAKSVFVRLRAYLQKNDENRPPINMVFTGGNGVGKSTVARIFTELLYKYQAISVNHYVEANAKTLFNNYTGETKSKIDDLYNEGKGGVILIDDFHFFNAYNSSNIKEGIDTISSLMHSDSKTTFILVDTKSNMKQVLDDNYDSLSDVIRFRVNFDDFSRDELKQILVKKIEEKNYTITEEAMNSLLDVIFLAKSYGNNINASAALSILEEVIVAQNVRCSDSVDNSITKEDVGSYISENDIAFIDQKTGGQSDARKKLDELIGLENIKETVDDLIAYFNTNRGKRVDFHMVFTGNPGTGKTEVARIIGKLLRQEGILGTSRFLEVTRSDLIGEYIGQTSIKTREVIEKAMGGVLYIDEAYSLAYGGERDFGPEAVAELLKAMEDRRGEFCVIMAGYTSEMKKLFDMNPGLKSRVKFDLNFPDYTDEELEKILKLFLKRDNNTMSQDNIRILLKLISKQRELPNFANVRTLREYLSRVQIKQARRIRQSQLERVDTGELTFEDILLAFGKKEVDEIIRSVDSVVVPKLNPIKLRDSYQDYESRPFAENKELIAEAVVAIKKEGDITGESSGFIVSKDGYVVTCAHCVKDATKISVRRRIVHRNKNIDISYSAKLVSIDEKADVAIIKLDSEKGEEFDCVSMAYSDDSKPEPLSEVYLMGYPFGVSRFDAISTNMGRIVSYQKDDYGYEQINLDISAKGGNSGSLVVDSKTSRVIGVLVGSSISHQDNLVEEINYCRPVSYVWDLIDKDYAKEQKNLEDDSLSSSIFSSKTFTYANNKTDFEVEYLEYLEDAKTTISHCYYTRDELRERNGQRHINVDRGNLNFTFSGVVNDQYYFTLYREVYEYSYRKIKDFILDESHPIFDERVEQGNSKDWIRVMVRLIKK